MHALLSISLCVSQAAFASKYFLGSVHAVDLPRQRGSWNDTCSVQDRDLLLVLPQSMVCPLHEASAVVTKDAPSNTSLHSREPWTQLPSCINNTLDGVDTYCIFTSSTFAHNRGISLLTTPAVARDIAQSPAFTNPSILKGINVEENPPYTVQSLPGKGMGVIVNHTLHRGDTIFAYTPVFILNRKAFEALSENDRLAFQHQAIDRLPDHARHLFLNLHGHFGIDKVEDIMLTNSFQVELGQDEELHNVILPEISRINHDCRPNAHYYFDENTLTHYVHAIRTIHAGEELSISYTDTSVSRAERQAAIKHSWGFDCACSLCTQRDIFVAQSDARLELIEKLQTRLDDWSPTSVATPEMAETLVSLYEQERLYSSVGIAHAYAALAFNAVSKEAQALKHAALAVELGILESGPEFGDVQAMKELIADPQSHWSWNHRLRGKRSIPG